jgi:uncharacterized protein involved in type VI secretion and phage assembly
MNGTYYGKYRGKVLVNEDEQKIGRLRVQIPALYGTGHSSMPWALPCVPYAGKGVGLFLIPPIGANVWIEFENGNPDFPIWTGCFWEKQHELPATNPNIKVLKTDIGTIEINDDENQKSIKITNGTMKIEMNALEIEISTEQGASVKLNGNKVSINGNALEVT